MYKLASHELHMVFNIVAASSFLRLSLFPHKWLTNCRYPPWIILWGYKGFRIYSVQHKWKQRLTALTEDKCFLSFVVTNWFQCANVKNNTVELWREHSRCLRLFVTVLLISFWISSANILSKVVHQLINCSESPRLCSTSTNSAKHFTLASVCHPVRK